MSNLLNDDLFVVERGDIPYKVKWEELIINAGENAKVAVEPNAPSTADEGDLWFCTTDGRLYIYYTDPGGTSQWIDASPENGVDVFNLQTVTDNGNTTTNDIEVGSIKADGSLDVDGKIDAGNDVEAVGLVHSRTGVKFPDGTIQTTAAQPGGSGSEVGNLQTVTDNGTTTTHGLSVAGGNIQLKTTGEVSASNYYIGLIAGTFGLEGDTRIEMYGTESQKMMLFKVGNSNKMNITSDGDTGIGTTVPQSKLDIKDANPEGFAGIRVQNNNANIGIAGIEFSSDGIYTKSAIGFERSNLNGRGALVFYNDISSDAANWSKSDEVMRISNLGNVDIGGVPASAPNIQLKNDGSITAAGKAELAGQKHIFFTDGEAQLAGNKVNIQPSGSITAAGSITAGDAKPWEDQANRSGTYLDDGYISCYRAIEPGDSASFINCYDKNNTTAFRVDADGSGTFAGTGLFGAGRSGETLSINDGFSIETSNASGKSRGLTIYGNSDIPPTYEAFQIRGNGSSVISAKYDGSITAANNLTLKSTGTAHRSFYFNKDDADAAYIKYRGDNSKLIVGNNSIDALTIGSSGNATFAGTVTSSNITLFKTKLKTAITSATDLASVKTAILDALEDLVPSEYGGN